VPRRSAYRGRWSWTVPAAVAKQVCPRARVAGVAARAAEELMRPVILIMTRRMLLGIKERAECQERSATASVLPR